MTANVGPNGYDTLEPKPVWQFFAELASVPRPSKHEEQIRAHIRKMADRLGFRAREDSIGNIVIEVPASPGCENASVTVLQGHVDMVCEKNAGTKHDFERDPIRLVVDKLPKTGETIVRADGTTLGADNGIGLSLALAAATTPGVVHGPLEILCTIDEEMGMTGARQLTPDFIKGRQLLNLDSEEDDALYIGCAGGCDATLTWELKTAAPPKGAEVCKVTIGGLRGGHSGVDIHLNRVSALKLLVRTLREAGDRLQLASLTGGSKRNVIPREATALVVGPRGTAAKLTAAAEEAQTEAVRAGEETCAVRVEKETPMAAAAVASRKDTQRVLTAMTALPHGVLAVVPEIAGLIQTSNSMSTVENKTADGTLSVAVGCLSRSSSMVQLRATTRQLVAIGNLAGAKVDVGNGYPGWQPNVSSPLLAKCKQIYERLFGAAPKVAAIHAGLECGIIGERIGAGTMDMISFGPHIEGAHSPDEHVWVESVQKSWKYLTAVLAELARP